jgi:hypothetical protein
MARLAQFLRVWAAAGLLCGAAAVRADVYVIVHPEYAVRAMTRAQTLDLFMGRTRHFPNGDPALPLDQPRNSPARARFYRALTGMDLAQVNSYWARLMFSGQTMPPESLSSEAAVLAAVKHNPAAIGYVLAEPADRSVHVVFVLKEAP